MSTRARQVLSTLRTLFMGPCVVPSQHAWNSLLADLVSSTARRPITDGHGEAKWIPSFGKRVGELSESRKNQVEGEDAVEGSDARNALFEITFSRSKYFALRRFVLICFVFLSFFLSQIPRKKYRRSPSLGDTSEIILHQEIFGSNIQASRFFETTGFDCGLPRYRESNEFRTLLQILFLVTGLKIELENPPPLWR